MPDGIPERICSTSFILRGDLSVGKESCIHCGRQLRDGADHVPKGHDFFGTVVRAAMFSLEAGSCPVSKLARQATTSCCW